MKFQMSIGPVNLNPVPPREALSRAGGGRGIEERVSILKTTIPQVGHLVNRRVTVTSPDERWAIRAAQADALEALQRSSVPFTVTLLGYEVEGTFLNVNFDGEAVFPRLINPLYRGYRFTLYLGA